jgi:hypothetical protein
MAKVSVVLNARLQHPTILNGQIRACLVVEGEASWVPMVPGFDHLMVGNMVILGVDEIQINQSRSYFRQVREPDGRTSPERPRIGSDSDVDMEARPEIRAAKSE